MWNMPTTVISCPCRQFPLNQRWDDRYWAVVYSEQLTTDHQEVVRVDCSHKPTRYFTQPPLTAGFERDSSIHVLRVRISSDLSNGLNTERVLHKAPQLIYALKGPKGAWFVNRVADTSLCRHYGFTSNLCSPLVEWVHYYWRSSKTARQCKPSWTELIAEGCMVSPILIYITST